MTETAPAQTGATAISPRLQKETTVLVKSSTPFVSAVKRIDRMLEKYDKGSGNSTKYHRGEYKRLRYLTIKGMGAAMQKTVSLALHYETTKGHQIDIYTGTTTVLDSVAVAHIECKDDSEDETELRPRPVSYVEVRIHLKKGKT